MMKILTISQKKRVIEDWLIEQYLKVEDYPDTYQTIYHYIQFMRKKLKVCRQKKVLKHFDYVYNLLFLSNWTHMTCEDIVKELGYS